MVPSGPLRRAAAFIVCMLGLAGEARAVDYNHLSLSGEAISGFDVVAYWRTGTPIRGTRAYSTEWHGSVWLFASASDLAAFKAAPERYAPQFGGYCAYAMSRGIKADIHPYIFKINGGKLFLFYSFESRDKFLADTSLDERADDQWQVLSERVF